MGKLIMLLTLPLGVGTACVVTQCILWLLFVYCMPTGPWRQEPGFTAHQIVCLPLMIYLAWTGVIAWLAPDEADSTPESRVLTPHPLGEVLSKVVFGELLMWDIPTGLLVQSLREPLMLTHHVAMLMLAFTGLLGFWSYYAIFFFGVIEVSGVFLTFVDVFHPKHKPWCAYLKTAPRLNAFNNAMRAAFFVTYMFVRAILFPFVIFAYVLPDAYAVSTLDGVVLGGYSMFFVSFVPVLGVLFTILQLFWAQLLIRQVLKLFCGGIKDE